MRDFFLRACVAVGMAVALVTEILSPFHLLHRGPLTVVWLAILVTAAWLCARRAPRPKISFRPVEAAIALACAAIAGIVAVTAWMSPPNSADAMAYHLPRVVYWAQAGSVSFFPTPYFNQVCLQPLAEYFYLHTYLLSGGDHFVNLVTWVAFLAGIIGVSALAGALGAGSRGQALAALFCATLPNGILQASGAKNEWMLALWLICAAYFAVREDALFTGLALGLALAAKATAYLFAPPLLLAIVLIRRPHGSVRALWPGSRPVFWRSTRRSTFAISGSADLLWASIRLKATVSFAGATSIPAGARRSRISSAIPAINSAAAANAGIRRYSMTRSRWKSGSASIPTIAIRLGQVRDSPRR